MTTRDELRERIGLIEESYEFFLAYAAQGHLDESASPAGTGLRSFLQRSEQSLDGLAGLFEEVAVREHPECADQVRGFLEVLARDAASSLAAIRLVSAQPAISSQLVDNLNASIHVRALLTDLFLIDEVLKVGAAAVAVDVPGPS